jgi:hypothetical protein
MIVKTSILIRSALEHQILDWAVNLNLYDKTENAEPSGWQSWDRTRVLTLERLLIDSETPQITNYLVYILQRLHGLEEGTKDKYAQIAKDLESRIHRVNEGLLSTQSTTKMKTAAAHG